MIEDQNSETKRIAPGNGHCVEEPVKDFVEIIASYMNPLFTNTVGEPFIDPQSTRYVDAFSSYRLLPRSTTTQSFSVNPSYFGFPKGLGNLYFSTTHVVDTVGTYSLPETSVTQVTPTQPIVHTYSF
jgi:hypothetical protein